MKEFSPKERWIIANRLINGTNLPGLFDDNFLANAKVMIYYNLSGKHRIDFFSDTITGEQANEEIVNTVNLINYLLTEGYVAKYPPPGTSLKDFDNEQQVSIGNSMSSKAVVFLLNRESQSIVDFIRRNDDYTFKGTEALKILVGRNFQSLQELQFAHTIRITNRGQWISVIFAILTLIATATVNRITWNRNDISNAAYRAEILLQQSKFDEIHSHDSMSNVQLRDSLQMFKGRLIKIDGTVDSLIRTLKPKLKPKKRKADPT